MTFVISWPTAQEKEIVDAIRGAIGREVVFYYVASSTACDICSLDPVTNLASDPFCVYCSGFYWIPTYSGYTISAHVTWRPSDIQNWYTGGQQFDGDCKIQVEFSTEIASIIDIAEYVVVDGKIMEIDDRTLRGVQTINRIIINLLEREK